MENKIQNPVLESAKNSLWEAFRDGDFHRLENIARGAGLSRESLNATYRGFLQQLEARDFTYGPATATRLYCYAELARKYGLEGKASQLYEKIIEAHEKAGRKEAAKRVRMVAGLTEDQRKNYIEKRLEGEISLSLEKE